MVKRALVVALVIGALTAPSQPALEELVRSALTLYLIVAGFLVMVLQRRAWDFIRPLLGIGLALLVLPPFFYGLVRNIQMPLQRPHVTFTYHIGSEWLWPPLAALATFIFVRLLLWYRRRPRNAPRQIFRERERVLPHFDVDDEAGE
jgi:hypothetical protein